MSTTNSAFVMKFGTCMFAVVGEIHDDACGALHERSRAFVSTLAWSSSTRWCSPSIWCESSRCILSPKHALPICRYSVSAEPTRGYVCKIGSASDAASHGSAGSAARGSALIKCEKSDCDDADATANAIGACDMTSRNPMPPRRRARRTCSHFSSDTCPMKLPAASRTAASNCLNDGEGPTARA